MCIGRVIKRNGLLVVHSSKKFDFEKEEIEISLHIIGLILQIKFAALHFKNLYEARRYSTS